MDTRESQPNQPVKITPNTPLANYTTFRLGGPCHELIECETPDQLISTIHSLHNTHKKFILIGGGSNLVVSDHGLPYTVIRYITQTPLITVNNTTLTVSASTILDDLAVSCVEEGLEGLNFTTGIPGTVGGAVVGNAGAWGKQVGDVLSNAVIIDPHGQVKTVDHSYFAFDYRHSHLKESNDIVVSVTFNLHQGDPIALANERAEILKMRAEKHPNLATHPCAGSFFRNVEPTSKADRRQAAGWFLEQAGGKDLQVGGAKIFDKHANIIVKGERCRAQDIHDIHLRMIELVESKFGFKLQREVRFVGKFDQTTVKDTQGFW